MPAMDTHPRRSHSIMITNLSAKINETDIWQLSSAIKMIQIDDNSKRPGMKVGKLQFISDEEANKFLIEYNGTTPFGSSGEPFHMIRLSPLETVPREPCDTTNPAYRTVLIRGLPIWKKMAVFSFADSLCNHFGNVRFPDIRQEKKQPNEPRAVSFIFETEADAEQFVRFPHANPFPGSRLILSRVDSLGETMEEVIVEPPEINTNSPGSRVVVLFQDLPQEITEEDLIVLIGEDFVKLDEDGHFCIKLFPPSQKKIKKKVSAKVVMTRADYAQYFINNLNGETFHPYNVPIRVCLN